ncbi:MAG: efflux RND transporter permease subunit, partial [Planctomycetota bacterium]|nr:efflux RND transporter permease subunit [Planctomycetota bacterium]
GAVSLEMLYDRSLPIRESIADVSYTLIFTFFLVVLVIHLFLHSGRTTLIPAMALPFSIVGTFGFMYLCHFSLDNLSLMALTLAIGFVVDDAIVMLENIVRHLEAGKGPLAAALDGSREIFFTIVSMTLSLAAVFIPVLFLGGMIGRLFNEFAVTIAAAILISGLVALTLTPMLCSRLLASGKGSAHAGRFFAFALRFYEASLAWCLRRHRFIMLVSAAILVATIWLFVRVPKSFVPTEDRGMISIMTEAPEGTSFEAMREKQLAAAEIVAADPDVSAFMCGVGMGGLNSGRMFVRLRPREERDAKIGEIAGRLRQALAQVPGIRAIPRIPETIPLGSRFAKAQYQYTLMATDLAPILATAPALESRLRRLEEITDLDSDLRIRNPEIRVRIDRDKASALGLTAEQIERTLYNAYGSRQIASIYAATNTYPVLLELLPEYQRDMSALNLLYLRSSRNTLIPLSTVATLTPATGPLAINHSGQIPSVTLSFNVKPGVALDEAFAKVETAARETLPAEVSAAFQGAAQAFQDSLKNLPLLLIAAIAVIYIVLGILYESYVHPLTILSGLPAAGLGALLTLLVFGADLDLYAFVGIIMLVGLVKKNGIMMVDFAIAERERGAAPAEAIARACAVRFRPIMMTTMAALMAGLPIALGWGAGAETRRPLGLAVVGGLFVSQFLTLYLTPVFYLYAERWRDWWGRGRQAAKKEKA